ncbi:MAG: excinuclease ABC subunit UvrC [Myxococcales bacterium]|nr:MAG: excinuclease ABC subunit UvrC [Myxococcales bacterium]
MHALLKGLISRLPLKPGVYIFKNAQSEYLYIGKASNLRNRVRSYFQESTTDTRFFIPFLHDEVESIETIVVANEKEAALLENTLIKQHKPKYNVKLRDDKEYLSLRLDPKIAWPRLEAVRKPQDDEALYFGPYPSATTARRTLRLINRHFRLRTCTDREFSSRKRPCLQYQIKRCPAPCVLSVDKAQYDEQIKSVALFLNGQHDRLLNLLNQRMHEASLDESYELAAIYRDQLNAVQNAVEKQSVAMNTSLDQDVIHLFREEKNAAIAMLWIRSGKLIQVRNFFIKNIHIPDEELLSAFVSDYYSNMSFAPDEIVVPQKLELMDGIQAMLSEKGKKAVKLRVPQKGIRLKLLSLARDNAEKNFKEHKKQQLNRDAMLASLQKLLRLETLPRRIECIDISHSAGQDTVASIVSMQDGLLNSDGYRSFTIKTTNSGDDYTAMHEALSRRFRRARDQEKGWELPDLLVVDGGKGQLKIAETVLREMAIDNVAIAGLAKGRINALGQSVEERIFTVNRKNPVSVSDHRETLFLTTLRDEAHRRANRLRIGKNAQRFRIQRLDQIAGVGKKTRINLIKALGSLDAVKKADLPQLLAAGANKKQAQAIYEIFHGDASAASQEAELSAVDNAFDLE